MTSSELPPLEDEEEPEDAVYMRVSTLKDEDDQYGLHVAHGWDNTAKGGGIQLYPNVPYIAIPIPRFQSRVQVQMYITIVLENVKTIYKMKTCLKKGLSFSVGYLLF